MKSINKSSDCIVKQVYQAPVVPSIDKKILKYFLIYTKSTEELIEAVNAHLEDGWQLYGDTFIGCRKHNYENGGTIIRDLLMQAVVKYEN